MKHNKGLAFDMTPNPAAFRRLCVETGKVIAERWLGMPAAFRRLCVETARPRQSRSLRLPAAFRRLCVETHPNGEPFLSGAASRLQAAVC